MSGNSTRKLVLLSLGFGVLVVAALLTTHRSDSSGSEPAVVATTAPPLAAHAPTTGTHPIAEEHKQELATFIGQATLTPCTASPPKTANDTACRAAIEAHARRAGYEQGEIDAYLDSHRQ
ncbi:MAG: hypothetical protein PGN19_16710 [Pseudomonas oryzihabitans]